MFSKVYSEKYWSLGIFHGRNLCGQNNVGSLDWLAQPWDCTYSLAQQRHAKAFQLKKERKKKETENLPYVTQNTRHLSVPLP